MKIVSAGRAARGFSLLELAITLVVMLILMSASTTFFIGQLNQMNMNELRASTSQMAMVHNVTWPASDIPIGGPLVDDLLTLEFSVVTNEGTVRTWSDPNFTYSVSRDYSLPRAAYTFSGGGGRFNTCYIPPDNPNTPGSWRIVALACTEVPVDYLLPTSTSVPQVAGLTAESHDTWVELTWQPLPPGYGDVAYRIYRCDSTAAPCTPDILVASPTVPEYIDYNRSPSANYTYGIVAVTETGVSEMSGESSAATEPAVPNVVQAQWDTTEQAVVLKWLPPAIGSSYVSNYEVLRCEDPCTPTRDDILASVAPDGANMRTYTDVTAEPGIAYQYAVVSVNTAGATDPRNAQFLVLTPPARTTGLTFEIAADSSQVVLNWSPAALADTYVVYRCADAGCTPGSYQTGIEGITFTDTQVTPGTTYWYQIAGVNEVDTGQRTNKATVEVLFPPEPSPSPSPSP